MRPLGAAARAAAKSLALSSSEAKNQARARAAAGLRSSAGEILAANEADVREAAGRGLSASMLDRLELDAKRIESIAAGLDAIRELPDPIGRILAEWRRPDGLLIQRVCVP